MKQLSIPKASQGSANTGSYRRGTTLRESKAVGEGMEQESDMTGVKSWLGAQCPCDLGHLPVGLGRLWFLNRKSCIPESPGSQAGLVGHLRPKENPIAILSYSFRLSTKGGNTYFVKVVGEGNERSCVNYASHRGSFIDVHSFHPHHDPGWGGSAQQGFPREGRVCTQHSLWDPRHFQLLI